MDSSSEKNSSKNLSTAGKAFEVDYVILYSFKDAGIYSYLSPFSPELSGSAISRV